MSLGRRKLMRQSTRRSEHGLPGLASIPSFVGGLCTAWLTWLMRMWNCLEWRRAWRWASPWTSRCMSFFWAIEIFILKAWHNVLSHSGEAKEVAYGFRYFGGLAWVEFKNDPLSTVVLNFVIGIKSKEKPVSIYQVYWAWRSGNRMVSPPALSLGK